MEIDRRAFIASLGGTAQTFPTMAEIEAQIETRPMRRGVGNLYVARTGNVKRLPAMPEKPTLMAHMWRSIERPDAPL